MATNESALLNKDFLKELFSERRKVTYARITSLDIDENPVQSIEGRITSGSVNLDGRSSLRRTCSLTMATSQDTEIYDYYWGLTTKFKLEQGLLNEINPIYPDIIWFELGTYVITSFNVNQSTDTYNISISGKDKMCLLNGDVSGAIYASVDFGTEEVKDEDGNVTIQDMEIPYIIREAVHEYAHEPWHNIIIKDLPVFALNLMEWEGDTPLYILLKADNMYVNNFVTDKRMQVYTEDDLEHGTWHRLSNQYNDEDKQLVYFPLNYLTKDIGELNPPPTQIALKSGGADNPFYYAVKVEQGMTAGYELTSLIYPRKNEESGLVANIGETVTSILDKIVDFLGNYEYFYNEKGQFIFQKKDKYVDTHWSSVEFDMVGLGNTYEIKNIFPGDWNFEGSELITSYSSSPVLNNIRNDYSIWGLKKSVNGSEIPIHLRYAIDTKPKIYTSISATAAELVKFADYYPEYNVQYQKMIEDGGKQSITYWSLEYFEEQGSPDPLPDNTWAVDWRELIYQMALDYRAFNHWDDFNAKIIQANGPELYPGGITGYEQYYVDIQGFWRYLYRPPYDKDANIVYELLTLPNEDSEQGEFPTGNQEIYLQSYYRNANLEDGITKTYAKQLTLTNDADPVVKTTVLDTITTKYGASNLGSNAKTNKVPLEIYINRNMPILTTENERAPLNYITKEYGGSGDVDPECDLEHLILNQNASDHNRMDPFEPGENGIQDLPDSQGRRIIDFRHETIKGTPRYNSSGTLIGYDFDFSKNYFYVKNDIDNKDLYDVSLGQDRRITDDNPAWEFDADANHRGLKCENYSLLISYDDGSYHNPVHPNVAYPLSALTTVAEAQYSTHRGINDNMQYNSYTVYRVDMNNSEENPDFHYQMFKYNPSSATYDVKEVDLTNSNGVKWVEGGDFVYLPSGFKRALNNNPYKYYWEEEKDVSGHPKEKGKALTLKVKYTYYVLTKVKPLITSFSYPYFTPSESLITEGVTFYQVDFDKQVSFSEVRNLNEIALQLPWRKEKAFNPNADSDRDKIGMVYRPITYDFTTLVYNITPKQNPEEYLSQVRTLEKVDSSKKPFPIGVLTISWEPINPEDPSPDYHYTTSFTIDSSLTDDKLIRNFYSKDHQLRDSIQIIERSAFNDLGWANREDGENPVLDRYNPDFDDDPTTSGEGEYNHSYLLRSHEPISYYVQTYQYDYSEKFEGEDSPWKWWNILVKDSPESLIFWFDFLDEPYSEIGKYGVKQVMDRSKAENNTNASAICFRENLNLVYYYSDTPERLVKGAITAEYDVFKLAKGFRKFFRLSSANKSCKDILDDWLYNHTQASESISITTVPIYTLQPNNRINVDGDMQINGEYVVNSFSIPLTYNGLSTLQCTKVASTLY